MGWGKVTSNEDQEVRVGEDKHTGPGGAIVRLVFTQSGMRNKWRALGRGVTYI